ncbi:MAG: hypothetical protein LAO77_15080 [Acidobacteriia bacterium]|nr:hypothetical protein [Terriglobia bacterium]
MKQNGSIYVSLVIIAVAGYFTYQWWFNPSRAIKRQLGELAAALSVPDAEGDVARVARFAQLRRFFADNVRARQGPPPAPEITSRDALLAAVANWAAPPGGRDVQFVDVQIAVDSDATAHAFLTVEVTTPDERTRQPVADSRDARVQMALQNGAWVITSAEPYDPQARQ